jgi:IS30 family transposase
VAQKLALQWSPQQISGWLKQEFPTHQDMQIYRSLFIQTRGVLKKELTAQLRTARRMRHPKSHNAKSGQGHILEVRRKDCTMSVSANQIKDLVQFTIWPSGVI